MPEFAIIDSHVHLYDPAKVNFPWLSQVPQINAAFLFDQYIAAHPISKVEKLVFEEVWAAPDENIREVEWIDGESKQHMSICAAVAAVPLEDTDRTKRDLDTLRKFPFVKGIRRITQTETDPDFCTRPSFVESVRLLGDAGYVCDLCILPHQIDAHRKLVEACPGTTFVLNHLGKPAIKSGDLRAWRTSIVELARLPNAAAKVSGLVTQAKPGYSDDEIIDVIQFAMQSFGFDRLMFGSDWPVLTLNSTTPERWIEIVDRAVSGAKASERERLYRGTAASVYKL